MFSNNTAVTMSHCNDNAFAVSATCRAFDFTLLFEQTILSILPSTILILLAPWRLFNLIHQEPKVFPGSIRYAKMVLFTVYGGLQLASLVAWATARSPTTHTSIADAVLRLIDAVVLYTLSDVEYHKSICPSVILNSYLLFTALFDTVQIRTLWLMSYARTSVAVLTASLAIKLIILILESRSKVRHLYERYQGSSPESVSGIFSRTTFWWLNPLLWRGFRALLSPGDIFEIDEALSSQDLETHFRDAWASTRAESKVALLQVTFWVLRGPFLVAALSRLAQSAFTFFQPFLVASVIDYVSNLKDQRKDYGYGLIGATVLVYVGLAISSALYKHNIYRAIVMARGGLVCLLYDKTLKLHVSNLRDAAGMTLMSTDIESIAQGLTNVHEIWASMVDTGVAIYLLQRRVGIACLPPIAIAMISLPCSGQIAKLAHNRQKNWSMAVQERISLTSRLLKNIKWLRMTNLIGHMANLVQDARNSEVTRAKQYFWIDSLMNLCANTPSILSPMATIITFAFYSFGRSQRRLETSNIFSSLTIVSLMTSPLGLALNAIPMMAASSASFERIQAYLQRKEREDYRFFQPINKQTRPKDPNENCIELMELRSKGDVRWDEPAFSITEGTFGFDTMESAVLRDINIEAWPRSITVVMGPVGSGKTSLFKALLGEARCFNGVVSLQSDSIAYCAQEPWIQNMSLRDSILGGLEMDPKFYETVIKACGLDRDLSELPQGEHTILGSQGTNLSGGQSQRVALARAVYSRKSLILLDDCLSGFDSKTEELVLKRLFGPQGLFRRLSSTVILATHNSKHAQFADEVIKLNAEGRISSCRPQAQTQLVSIHNEPFEANFEGTAPRYMNEHMNDSSLPGIGNNTDSTRQRGDLAVYRYYLRTVGFLNALIYVFLTCVIILSVRFSQVWLEFWIAATDRTSGLSTDIRYGCAYAAFGVVGLIFYYLALVWMFQMMVPRSAKNLHWSLLQATTRASFFFLSSTDSGSILNRFSQDVTMLDHELPGYAVQFVYVLLSVVGQAALIIAGVKYLAATIPVMAAILYLLQQFYLRTSRQIRLLDLEAKSPLYSHMLETYNGLESVRAFGWQTRLARRNRSQLQASQKPYYALFCIQRWLNLVLSLMVGAIAVLLVALGTKVKNSTSASAIGVAFNNVVSFAQSLALLTSSWTSLETSLGAILRIRSYIKNVVPEGEIMDQDPPIDWASSGPIEWKDATISYSPSEKVLNGISLMIQPGMKIGICGRSGSEKSSLILSLLNMASVTNGSIMVGNRDISTISGERIRRAFNVIPQMPVLLPGTVRLNVSPVSARTDLELISTLTELGLWDMINSYGGLDAEIETISFSQGQKQLFCLARSLLSNGNRKILLLDEFSSSIDSATERKMMEIVEREFADHTVIMVAHRLNTIVKFDKIAVLDSGRLAEFGSPEKLLENGAGVFKTLWDQFNTD